MKKFLARALLISALLPVSVFAADKVLDLSSGCKVYKLENKAWVPTDAASMEGLAIPAAQILKPDAFFVFKNDAGTFGVNQKCVKEAAEAAAAPAPKARPTGKRRAAAPAPDRGDTHSPWSTVFGLGYNLAPSGKIKSTYQGVTEDDGVKFTGSLSFFGEVNYRFNSAFRTALELGISQLSVDTESGNETSFFDFRPEYVFRRPNSKFEYYIGPMIGLFFLSQNTETRVLTGANAGVKIDIKQSTATTLLLGVGGGVDYALNEQFDLGFYIRYFKPGTMKVTGTETFPTPGNTYEADLTTSYITSGLRFAIHF
jgi:opacity protein-like surface antigen